jgi:hypothetical protein
VSPGAGVWTGEENLTSTGIQSPDRPARSESLYRLGYSGSHRLEYLYFLYSLCYLCIEPFKIQWSLYLPLPLRVKDSILHTLLCNVL